MGILQRCCVCLFSRRPAGPRARGIITVEHRASVGGGVMGGACVVIGGSWVISEELGSKTQ